MKVNCRKTILNNCVNTVMKAVTSRTTLPILECMLLNADRDGFRLMSNDLDLSIETKNIECDVFELGSVAIDAKMFSNIVRTLPEEDVIIESDDKNCVFIKSGKAEFKISGQPGENFPVPPQVEKNSNLSVKSKDFKEMIRKTIFSVATEELRPILTGELIEINENVLNMVSIDGYRVSNRRYKADSLVNFTSIVIPAKTLNEISRITDDKEDSNINIYFTDRHILFEMENCTVISRLLEGEFPDYKSYFVGSYKTMVNIKREDILSLLERSLLISKDNKKPPVKLDIKENRVAVNAVTELGEINDEINADIEGEEIVIGFNPKYLIDVLKVIDDEYIDMQFTGGSLAPCIIKNKEESYRYLVLPVKI